MLKLSKSNLKIRSGKLNLILNLGSSLNSPLWVLGGPDFHLLLTGGKYIF
jgi:hypothetical protein